MSRPSFHIGYYRLEYSPTVESGDYAVILGSQVVARFRTLSTAQAWATGRTRDQYANRQRPVDVECTSPNS